MKRGRKNCLADSGSAEGAPIVSVSRSAEHRRRLIAVAMIAVLGLSAGFLGLRRTTDSPVRRFGVGVSTVTIESRAVGGRLRVTVVVPPGARTARPRALLVFLHGRGANNTSFLVTEMFQALAGLGRHAPIVAFPDGGDHSYWHDRREGAWGRYVTDEVIPGVGHRFGAKTYLIR